MSASDSYVGLVNLHSGDTLHLALSDKDKILVTRSFIQSVPLQDQIVQDFLTFLKNHEQKSRPVDNWKLKIDRAIEKE